MDLEDLDKHYVCTSASWSILTSAPNPEEAASKALQAHMESSPSFMVDSSIRVVEVKLISESPIEIDSPSVLADLGFHKLSKDLSKAIKRDN